MINYHLVSLIRFSNFSPRKAAGEARKQVSRERQEVNQVSAMMMMMIEDDD